MIVHDVSLRSFSLPLSAPLDTAAGSIDRRDGFLIRVETENEHGIGEATPLPGWTESYEACRDALERAVDALPADESAIVSPLADVPAARHGLTLALADLRAKRAGDSLYRHLGRNERVESVPVNATLGDGPPRETAVEAANAVEAGYDCLKLKVGARSVKADRRRLRAVQEAVGPEVTLRADANGAWSRDRARAAFDAFEAVGVEYVEQPLPADDLEGLAALRGGPVGVAADETLAEHGVEAVLDADAADVLVLKPMALGGIERAREVARSAAKDGVETVVTTTVDAAVARTAAVHLAAALPDVRPCGLATGELLEMDVATDPAPVEEGSIRVPNAPGIGVADAWRDSGA